MSIYSRLKEHEQELRQLGQVLASKMSRVEMQRLRAICDGIMAERGRLRAGHESAWQRACAASIESSLPAVWE